MTITVQGAPLMAYLLASVRIVAWLAVGPPFSSRSIPSMAKVVLALGLSFVVAPALAQGRLPSSTPELLVKATGEKLNAVYFVNHLKQRYGG